MIDDKQYTIDYIEKRYNENPETVHKYSYSLGIKECSEVSAFMKAVDGLIKHLDTNDRTATAGRSGSDGGEGI